MPLVHRGFGAWVSCDGQELEHFQAKVEGDKVMSCYVPGDGSKEYKAHWIDSKPPTHLSIEVRTDGRRIGVVSHTKGSTKASAAGLRVPVDANCSSQFLHVSSGDDALPSAYNEDIGTIELRLRRARDFIAVPPTSKLPATSGSSRQRPHSNAGSTKRTPLGQREATQPRATVLRPILIYDKPYVTFRFMYRPREVLEANGIIPLNGTPPSASTTSTAKRRKRRSSEAPPINPASPQRPNKRRRMSEDEVLVTSTVQDRIRHDEGGEPGGTSCNAQTCDDQENGFDHAENGMPPQVESEMKHRSIPDFHELARPSEPAVDSDAEDERMVEVHLSARDVCALPDQSAAHNIRIKEEDEPAFISVKREPSPENTTSWSISSVGNDVTPKLEEQGEESESVVEVHVSSTNRHLVFGHPSPVHVKEETVKKEESPEPPDVLGRHAAPLVKRECEEETVVEVHISSKDIQQAFENQTRVKTEES
ncbi:hypothetical protein OH77DRAFT_1416315 [Trametes cingulata]|nr:hypothetical protein OH77DRAFT_1416315 [Trametes cingulata]